MIDNDLYPTMKHRWLHDSLKYAITQSDVGLKHYPDNLPLKVVKSIIEEALQHYEETLTVSTTVKEKRVKELDEVLLEIVSYIKYEYMDRHREPSYEEYVEGIKEALAEEGYIIVEGKQL